MTAEDRSGNRARPEPAASASGAFAFEALTPDAICGALESAGWWPDGRLLQLNSYENRVVQVGLDPADGAPHLGVAKFYRPGRWTREQILEEHRFARELADEGLPVVAPWTVPAAQACAPWPPHTLAEVAPQAGAGVGTGAGSGAASAAAPWRVSLSPCRSGRAPELESAETLQTLGRFVAQLHRVGARAEGAFAHRERLDVATSGQRWVDEIEALDAVPPGPRGAWAQATADALGAIAASCAAHAQAAGGPPQMLRLHGDLHAGNVLARDGQVHLVDLDDCCMGPALQDLWMLLSGDPDAARWQLAQLLEGYRSLRDLDEAERHLIPALRLTRMLRHNAWLARRWEGDPAFAAAWPDYGTDSYWAQQAQQLREQARADAGV